MPTVAAGSARVHYRTAGSGPGLALVHGTGFGAEGTWGYLVDRFTERHTVVLPNYAGTVETEDDGSPLTIEALAAQVAAAITDAGAAPVNLVGFSLGAAIAAAVAATRPELVRRLVLVAGLARADEYLRNLLEVWRRLADDAEGFGRFGTLTAFSREFINNLGEEGVRDLSLGNKPTSGALRQHDLLRRLDLRDLLPAIRAETLVIGCTQDATVPVGNARELQAAIAGSRYAEIDSGHVVLYERPGEFVELVMGFIETP